MSAFSCVIVPEARGLVLQVNGTLDYESVRDFDRAADELVSQTPKRVVLDASGLSYLNSAGIGVIMKLNRRLQEAQAELRLASVQPDVQRMLKTCFLDRVLKICERVEDALGD